MSLALPPRWLLLEKSSILILKCFRGAEGSRGPMAVRLANVLLLQRDIQGAIKFYSRGLGLTLASESPKYAELTCSAGSTIALKQVEG